MNKALANMTGEEMAAFLREMADKVQGTLASNKIVIQKLREAAEELESKRKGEHA